MIHYKNHLELIGYKESTVKNLVRVAQDYLQFESQNPETFYQYLKTRKHKKNSNKILSNSTLNTHNYGLKVYHKYVASYAKKTKETCTFFILNEKRVPKKIEVLSIEEVQVLFKNCQDSRDRAVLSCLYHLGLRVGEASNLKLEDLDFTKNLVFISDSKTGYQRQIPMSKNATAIFEKYLKTRNKTANQYFLQGLKGKLTPDGLAQIVKRTARKSKITKPVYPHLLRHSIATHLLINKMEIKKVAQFLGHKSLESTQRYTHLIEN